MRQLLYSRIAPSSISKIFISHLHGDHLYGIVPIILETQVNAKLLMGSAGYQRDRERIERKQRKYGSGSEVEDKTLEIYGPPGLYNYISMTLALSCAKVNYMNVVVYELIGGRQERGPNGNQRRGRRNVFLSHYPEVETRLVKRRYLEQVSTCWC
jgi:ribonuclease Z